MAKLPSTDYETYREVMDDLLKPIEDRDLDVDTLKRLYESKLIYLENLRLKCFREINGDRESYFKEADYVLVLRAIFQTRDDLRKLILLAVSVSLEQECG